MRRAFTFVEVLTVTALLFVIMTAMIASVSHARRRARISAAQSEMASIVSEVGSARDPDAVAARYASERIRDPWGNAYRVEVRRCRVENAKPTVNGRYGVWFPNAFSPRGGDR